MKDVRSRESKRGGVVSEERLHTSQPRPSHSRLGARQSDERARSILLRRGRCKSEPSIFPQNLHLSPIVHISCRRMKNVQRFKRHFVSGSRVPAAQAGQLHALPNVRRLQGMSEQQEKGSHSSYILNIIVLPLALQRKRGSQF